MTRNRRTSAELVARLRQGPLPASEWAPWSSSAAGLRVRIWRLRELGYPVVAEPVPDPDRAPGTRGRHVTQYRLLAEPKGTRDG